MVAGGAGAGVRVRCAPDGMIKDVADRRPSGVGRTTGSPAWSCPVSRTRTRMPSTGRCGAGPTAAAARSGPGGTACTRSPTSWTRTPTPSSPPPCTPRWCWRASPAWASSTTSTTARAAPVRRPERDGRGAAGGRPGRRHPAHPAGHVLPARRHRRAARGRAAPVRRPGRRELGDPGEHDGGRRELPRRRRRALVRAVPAEELDVVVEAAVGEDGSPRPLHVHVSEQPAENEACQSAYDCSPTELLSEHGVLGRRRRRCTRPT